MQKTLKVISLLSGFALLFGGVVPRPLLAQTSANVNIQSYLELISNLNKQIQELQAKLNALQTQKQEAVSELVTTLRAGSRGDQVKILQALLAADSDIYPEGLITGYFGPATERAVKRFQTKSQLPAVGLVGPQTRGKLNQMLKATPIIFEAQSGAGTSTQGTSSTSTIGSPCVIVPPGHLIAPGWLRKQGGVRPIVPACQTLPPGIAKKLGLATSTPDTTPPVISSIGSSVATSTATLTWLTNEPADSQVMFGLTSSYGSSTSLDAGLTTSHSQTVTGLATGTIYHFQVKSKDAAGNSAASTDQTFTTATGADTAPPAILSIATNVGTSTATVSWTTNEAADSQVMYGSTSAYGQNTTLDTTLVTSHLQTISGLSASTTHHFQVKSRDASGNVATSSDQTFTTNALPDTTAPVISTVSASVGTTTATVAWTTNEAATGKVYYSTVTPLDTAATSTLSVATTSLSTSHSFDLAGLNASTTYLYIVESADAAANRATSTEQSFTTSP